MNHLFGRVLLLAAVWLCTSAGLVKAQEKIWSATGVHTSGYTSDHVNFGRSLAVVDWDRDGHTDLLIGAPWQRAEPPDNPRPGAVFIVHGPLDASSTVNLLILNPNTTFGPSSTEDDDTRFGYDIAGVSGFRSVGDPQDQLLLIGEPGWNQSSAGSNTGQARLWMRNCSTGSLQHVAELVRPGPYYQNELIGQVVEALGDVNGDGYADVAVSGGNMDRGLVYYGSAEDLCQSLPPRGAAVVFENLGGTQTGTFAQTINRVGDIIGGQTVDVAVTEIGYSNGAGRVYIYEGGTLASSEAPAAADATVTGAAGEKLGINLAGGFDVTGDGQADLVIESSNQKLYILSTRPAGDVASAALRNVTLISRGSEAPSTSIDTSVDVNADGVNDIVIGQPGNPPDVLIIFGGSHLEGSGNVHIRDDLAANDLALEWFVDSSWQLPGFAVAAGLLGESPVPVVAVGIPHQLSGDSGLETGAVEIYSFLFSNHSAETGLSYAGDPYTSITLDFDADGDQDILVTDVAGFAGLFERRPGVSSPATPLLNNEALFEFDTVPSSCRGAAAGDFDNDGSVDLFLASDLAPSILRNDLGVGSKRFTDETAYIYPPLTQHANESWAGAWGDYDRDGHLDLYIARADGTLDTPTGPLHDVVLRGRGDGTFLNVSSALGIQSVAPRRSVGVTWADFNGDGELDILVGDATAANDSPPMQLFMVQSLVAQPAGDGYDHVFTEQAGMLARFPEAWSVAAWDLDNDGDPDAVMSGHTLQQWGCRIRWNDGTGNMLTGRTISPDRPVHTQGFLDADLDGVTDVVLATGSPLQKEDHARFFLAEKSGASVSYDDQTFLAGVNADGSQEFRALSVADFGGLTGDLDGDQDLFFGRPAADNSFYYKNQWRGTDNPENDWLKIQVSSPNVPNNRSAIGARVKVTTNTAGSGSFDQYQWVDGGSGAGSQSSPILTFGLGNDVVGVDVVVTWPDGSEATGTLTPQQVNQLQTFVDDHDVTIVSGSVSAYIIGGVGVADWIFTWRTNALTDPELDKVTIGAQSGRGCPDLSGQVLVPSANDVEVTVWAYPGGGYLHRLVWKDRDCYAPCSYNVTVESSTGQKTDSATSTISMPVCISY